MNPNEAKETTSGAIMSTDPTTQYRTEGYAIVRNIYDQARVERLQKICKRVHSQWQQAPLTDNPPVGPYANYMRHLNHPEYHRQHREDLVYLLDAIADPKLIEKTNTIMGEETMFFSLSYYFNPSGADCGGQWHKDKVFDSPDPRDQETGVGIQTQIALVSSDALQVVPGSHLREYTDTEHRICESENQADTRRDDMPEATQETLDPGDSMYFHHKAIHRGSMQATPPRQTMMISYRKSRLAKKLLGEDGLCQYSNQPWFLHPDYLDGTKESTREYFGKFTDLYGPAWRSQLSEFLKYRSLIENLSDTDDPNPFFQSEPAEYAG